MESEARSYRDYRDFNLLYRIDNNNKRKLA